MTASGVSCFVQSTSEGRSQPTHVGWRWSCPALCSEVEFLRGSKDEERLKGHHWILVAVAPVHGLQVGA